MGSCTNSRIEDLRAFAADIIQWPAEGPTASACMVVPGSARVRLEAEAEGLDKVFKDFGAEWRFAGLLDVPRHEPRPARRRGSAARPRPTATSRAGRARVAAPTWSRPSSLRPPPSAARCRVARRRPRIRTTGRRSLSHGEVHHRTPASALPLRRCNVDTDQIIPAVYLKRVTKTGFEDAPVRTHGARTRSSCLNQAAVPGRLASSSPGPDFGTGSEPRARRVGARATTASRSCLEPALRATSSAATRASRACSPRQVELGGSSSALGGRSRPTRD